MRIREVCIRYRKGNVPIESGEPLRSSLQVFRAFVGLALEPVEVFRVIHLDSKNRMLSFEDVGRGTLTTCLVHPREVFSAAIKLRCAAIITLHNHPSGDPQPSEEDRAITRRLHEAGAILGIRLLDHIIITETSYYSFADQDCVGRLR